MTEIDQNDRKQSIEDFDVDLPYKIKLGELVEIERSATHKFLDYQITK